MGSVQTTGKPQRHNGNPRSEAVRAAREFYIQSPETITLGALSKKFKGQTGTSHQNLKDWSSKEDWPKQREEYQENLAELARLKSQPEVLKTLTLIMKGHLGMVNHAVQSLAKRAAGGELMQFGTASSALNNSGERLLEIFESTGVGNTIAVESQPLSDERVRGILQVSNPMDDKGENDGD